MNLPTGIVTFLFTEIEGSAQLWENHLALMPATLARHDALLRAAIEENRGHVFKTAGDQFCVAFGHASDALAAALAAQRALVADLGWEGEGQDTRPPLKVRMALHTGPAEERDGDYFGPTLNRVARLLAAGHGSQVLLSDATSRLAESALPEGAALRSLGSHRLRDLRQPEHIHQLMHPDLPAEFPPLRSLQAFANNLPQQMTSFVGRQQEIAEIKALLGKRQETKGWSERTTGLMPPALRLVTLTGAGGCGKTRLALQAAAELLEEYEDGAWLVELAPLTDPGLIPQAVATVLRVSEEAGKPLVQTLTEHLQTRQTLLILDNCEHLLNACAEFASALLRTCRHVTVLATSREALSLPGERTYRVPSLSMPAPKDFGSPPSDFQSQNPTSKNESDLMQYEAARLFVERAQLARSSFAISRQNAPAIAQLCVRLDGIPLAIELAAARVRAMSVEQIASRLDDRFRLLTGGSRAALPRQQTLRALIDWSYDLLSEPEKALLRRLSVFAGGFTLEAAEAICSVEAQNTLDLLTALVDRSLVLWEDGQTTNRYRLLETVRAYARDRLLETGEGVAVRLRHRDYFLQLAQGASDHLYGPEQVRWLDRLEIEHDNLRAALEWCKADPDSLEAGLRLAGRLGQFWQIRGYVGEGSEHLAALLAQTGPQEAPSGARADALTSAGILAWQRNDLRAARDLLQEALRLRQALGDEKAAAAVLGNLATVAHTEGDMAAARNLLQQSLEANRRLQDPHGIAAALVNLGGVVLQQGDLDAAHRFSEESLSLWKQIGNRHAAAVALNNLGTVARLRGDFAAAESRAKESLQIRRELGDQQGVAWSLEAFAKLATARAYSTAPPTQADLTRAAILFGAAEALRERGGLTLVPADRQEMEEMVAKVRADLEKTAFAAAWAQGRAMTPEQAMQCALEEQRPPPTTPMREIPIQTHPSESAGAPSEGAPGAQPPRGKR